jgi:hypothetical protein
MSFEQELLGALKAGSKHQELLELVHRHQEQGLPPREIYQMLEQIWLAFGFDGTSEGAPMRDELEFLMEKTWYAPPKERV